MTSRNSLQNPDSCPYVIEQTWWHISDTYFPYPSHHVRQVMDIALRQVSKDESDLSSPSIEIVFPNNTSSFRFYARNIGKEIAFILPSEKSATSDSIDGLFSDIHSERESTFSLHLPSYSEFPSYYSSPGSSENDMRYHLKLEVEYAKSSLKQDGELSIQRRADSLTMNKPVIIRESGFISYYWRRICNIVRPKMESVVSIPGLIFPEFSITLPKGWELETPLHARFLSLFGESKNGIYNIEYSLYWDLIANDDGDNISTSLLWDKILDDNPDLKCDYLESELFVPMGDDGCIYSLGSPDFEIIDGRFKYVYILSDESTSSYIKMKENYSYIKNNLSKKDILLQQVNTLKYNTELTTLSVMLSFWIPAFFAMGSVILLALTLTGFLHVSPDNISVWALFISFLVAYAAYLYTFFSYKKDGYAIPSNKVIVFAILMILFIGIGAITACISL
ncbi:MAG: hypothetical protein IJB12_03730 [Methanocorpusculum sp.]|nr:hypothetical protein [Methanocorpusculum sp.]